MDSDPHPPLEYVWLNGWRLAEIVRDADGVRIRLQGRTKTKKVSALELRTRTLEEMRRTGETS